MKCNRHSWKIKYEIPEIEGCMVVSIEQHTCRKCGKYKYITKKDIYDSKNEFLA